MATPGLYGSYGQLLREKHDPKNYSEKNGTRNRLSTAEEVGRGLRAWCDTHEAYCKSVQNTPPN